MRHKLLYLFILLLSSQQIFSQESTSKANNVITNDSLYTGGQITWGRFLKNNVDSTAPIRNRAKKGTYTVTVKFIVANDGSLSDIAAITNHGYGMEQEVIRVLKKSKSWTPAPQNNKGVNRLTKVSYTFTVTKRRLHKKRA
jgi:periplasmic protein TonB